MAGGPLDPAAVLAALAPYPPLAGGSARIAVVGGFVRDVWLGREPRELDLVVEGEVAALAHSLGGAVTVHEQFGTATVNGGGWRVDLAMARRERYSEPGALPDVEPATIEEDLRRRDFTVNAIAVTIPGGVLLAAPGALDDLHQRQLRVLHERSFIDDPTRVLRLARYASRLHFAIEPLTERLAAQATLATVSGARIGVELRLMLGEPDPLDVLERVAGKLPLRLDRPLLEAALALAPAESDRAMLVLGASGAESDWLDSLELTARERSVVAACEVARVPAEHSPSALWRAWHDVAIEAVAVAGARGDRGERSCAQRWIDTLRHVRLEIGGDDLLAAGLAEGPQIGARLQRTLLAKLDGELDGGRAAELAFALGEG